MYQISPMNWILICFFLIFTIFYVYLNLFSIEKNYFILKMYKKIYVK